MVAPVGIGRLISPLSEHLDYGVAVASTFGGSYIFGII